MPNIIVEKGGQTYRFGLNSDKTVTNGKAAPITYGGTTYYARYGTDATPLKTEVNGKLYYVQYDAADFKTINWQGTTSNTKTVFFPKGRYVVHMSLHQDIRIEVEISKSGVKAVTVTIKRLGSFDGSYRLVIDGVFNEVIYTNYNNPSYSIERIGE